MQDVVGHCHLRWAGLVACGLFLLPGCSNPQETKVTRAIAAKFPGGPRRCLNLGNATGIHVAAGPGDTMWYPSTGPTSPVRHLFVFWAARADATVPELVADLADRGVLTKATVEVHTDAETTALGAQTVSAGGIYDHPTLYRHLTRTFPVDIYTTKPFDDAFGYVLQTTLGPSFMQGPGFPSRLYDTPLPPPDTHYLVPTTQPYAISTVSAACFPETLDGVDAIRVKDNLFGGHYMEADVRFTGHPPPWMQTRIFQRAAIGPDTPSITKPRRATVILNMDGDKLTYVREETRP